MPSFTSISGASVSGTSETIEVLAVVSCSAVAVTGNGLKASFEDPAASHATINPPKSRKRSGVMVSDQSSDLVESSVQKQSSIDQVASEGDGTAATSAKVNGLEVVQADLLPATIAALRNTPADWASSDVLPLDGQGFKRSVGHPLAAEISPRPLATVKQSTMPVNRSSCLPATIAALKSKEIDFPATDGQAIDTTSGKQNAVKALASDGRARPAFSRKSTAVDFPATDGEALAGSSRKAARGAVPYTTGHLIEPTVLKDDLFGGICFRRARPRVTFLRRHQAIANLAERRLAKSIFQPNITAASERRLLLVSPNPRIKGSD